MIIATDLDNTLCLFPDLPKSLKRRVLTGEQRRLKIKLYRDNRENGIPNKELIDKLNKEVFFIITGRRPRWEKVTFDWLKKNKVNPISVFFFTDKCKTRENIIKYKANLINKLKVDIYYEDDEIIIKNLEKLCLKTKIINPKSKN